MVLGILAHREVGDRPLTAHRTVVAFVAKRVPGLPVEPEPGLDFMLRLFRNLYFIAGIFIGEPLQPSGLAFLLYAPAEGRSEFFAASSMNSTSTSDTLAAHHSTAATMFRYSGSASISPARSRVYS